ncbi:condensin-2 complex subunit G2-like [Anneissia japonica]|uniref:condensin-2 complex subunit G2-like n=1 Tax=Anneissia japonica TaxID=1529436 RepID=UPI0014256BFA|nr:condensin-2 complex subunit G2-like [Anneissia japonica]XP_033124192.1 condensin-2 complex subunit G2-like [Anneissia japonica]
MMIETLTAACNGHDPLELHDLISKHINKNDDFNLKDILPVCSRKKQEEIWEGLYEQMTRALTQAPLMPDIEDEALQATAMCLQDILTIAGCVLDQNKPIIPDKMLETITALHELLLEFPDKANKVQASIAKVCQTWWVKELPGREGLVANTIMFFLVKSIQPNASFADVKRVFSMRYSLLQIDFEDESSVTLKNLLLSSAISTAFLKADEGRRFVSFLFELNLEFVEQLHVAIKNQIPACPKPMIEWYGTVYVKAWKSATGPFIDKIEQHCIQDFMYHAVHASRAGVRSMASNLRKILGCFHRQKVHQGVDKMLLKLYNPILWRSLKVANGTVRANSITLLIDAFPLQDPKETKEERDNLLQKQFDILSDLLNDPCVVVRKTCVIGICRIFNVFWELIPIKTLEDLLGKLIQDLARDVSSTDVRAAVYKGLATVLDNRLSHGLMKRLLPQLGLLIHDSSEKVRVAFVELMLKVKGVRSIKVSEVVSVEHLLVRLELDSPPVVKRLVQLLFNSFQPLDKAGEVQLTRCIALVQNNAAAARVFYRYAHQHMSPFDSAKFLLLVCQCIFGCVNRSTSNDNDSDEETDKNADEEDTLSLADKDIIDGLLEVMVILWTSIDHQLMTSHGALRQKLVKRLSKAVPLFLDVFQGGRSLEAVLMLASFLPGLALPDFKENCLNKLKMLRCESSVNDFAPLLECLVSWGKGGNVLDIIYQRLQNIKNDSSIQVSWEEGASVLDVMSQRVQNMKEQKDNLKQCEVALRILDWLLAQKTTRTCIMQENSEHLLQVLSALKDTVQSIEINKAIDTDMEAILEQALYSYCKTTMHIQAEERESNTDLVGELLTSLMTSIDQEVSADQVMSKTPQCKWLKCILKVSAEAFMVGQVRDEIGRNIAGFLEILLQKDLPLELLPSIVLVLYHVSLKLLTATNEQDDIVPLLLSQIIKVLAQTTKDGSEEVEKILPSIKPGLTEVLRCYHRNHPENCQRILATIMAATLAELTSAIHGDENLTPSQSFGELPTLSAFLLPLVNSKPAILRCFLSELEQCIDVGAVQGIEGFLAIIHVLYTISKAGKRISGLKECMALVQQQIDPLKQADDDESSDKKQVDTAFELMSEISQHMGWTV